MDVVGIVGVSARVPIIEFLQRAGEDRCRETEGDSGIVIEDVCEDSMQNLGRRLVLMLIRGGILIGEVVVVAVGMMVVVAVVIISFSEKRCLSVMEVECEVISST